MEAMNIIPTKVELARECAHLGEFEESLVQYESALGLLKGLVNDIPDEAHSVRFVAGSACSPHNCAA